MQKAYPCLFFYQAPEKKGGVIRKGEKYGTCGNCFRWLTRRSTAVGFGRRTVVWNKQESRHKYWATRSSICSFACTAHSFACSGLLASLAPTATLTRSLACSLRSLPRSLEREFLMSQNDLVLSHSTPISIWFWGLAKEEWKSSLTYVWLLCCRSKHHDKWLERNSDYVEARS